MNYYLLFAVYFRSILVTGMQSSWNTGFEAFKDSVSENELDDAVSADDDTSESWTQPWDLPAAVNYAGHSDTSTSQGGLRDMTAAATADKNIPTEHIDAKG